MITFTVNVPNYNKIVAPERDFYVLGTINGDLPDDAKMQVSLYRNNDLKLVRRVYSEIKANKSGLLYDYSYIELKGVSDINLVKDSEMPDLVYDENLLESFKDQWRKLYFDDKNFTATFNGGRYDFDVNPNNEDGNSYESLAEGEYSIEIEAFDNNDNSLGKTIFEITIGTSLEKIMSRFSPDPHYENILQIVEDFGYTMYVDDFSGLFYDVPFLQNYPQEMQVWINRKWQFMDAIEYESGKTHFYIYNVSPESTTWKVELATIQKLQKVNNPENLKCYFYDIGDLQVASHRGAFVEFEPDKTLKLTRVDFPDSDSLENFVNVDSLLNIRTNIDISNGIVAKVGQIISLYGVVKPIQVIDSDLVYDEEASQYTINNRIQTIVYKIIGDGVDQSVTKEVGLNREFNSKYVGIERGKNRDYLAKSITVSLLEFKHDFTILEEWNNKKLTVVLAGYDSHGELIAGTDESFEINVVSK